VSWMPYRLRSDRTKHAWPWQFFCNLFTSC